MSKILLKWFKCAKIKWFGYLKIIEIMLLICFAITLSGCGDEKNPNVLIVGISPDNAPYEYLDEKSNIIGIDVEIIEHIGKKLNKTIKIKNIDFNALVPSLQAGHVDLIISGISQTPERAAQIDFSESYLDSSNAIFFLKENEDKFDSKKIENLNIMLTKSKSKDQDKDKNQVNKLLAEILQKKIVGVQTGSVGWNYLNKIQDIRMDGNIKQDDITLIKNFSIKAMGNNLGLLQELKLGNIDCAMLEQHQLAYILKTGLEVQYLLASEPGTMHIGMPKNSKLKPEIDKIIQEMIQDGSITKIVQTHINK